MCLRETWPPLATVPGTMAEPGSPKDPIVSSALSHAASIRRTLWMQEYKREHGGASPSLSCTTAKGESDGEFRRCESPPPLLNGPIYSAEYWRAWKSRSRAAARGGSRRASKSPHVSLHEGLDYCCNSKRQAQRAVVLTRRVATVS